MWRLPGFEIIGLNVLKRAILKRARGSFKETRVPDEGDGGDDAVGRKGLAHGVTSPSIRFSSAIWASRAAAAAATRAACRAEVAAAARRAAAFRAARAAALAAAVASLRRCTAATSSAAVLRGSVIR